MDKITFEDYKNALKKHFEDNKMEGFYGSGDVSNLTPAQLRDLCLRICKMGLSKADENTFRFFFDVKEDENLEKAIDQFGTGKLKSVISFLKADKNSENTPRIELAAIVTNFHPRPFKKFVVFGNDKLTAILEKNPIYKEVVGEGVYKTKKKKLNKILSWVAIPLLVISSGIFGIKHYFYTEKECIIWIKDHYEAFDYNEVNNNAEVIPFNKVLLDNFKKITVCDTTTFFKNGNTNIPLVWYGKSADKTEYEYFNAPGLHPETGKTLRPISKHIINKYIENCN